MVEPRRRRSHSASALVSAAALILIACSGGDSGDGGGGGGDLTPIPPGTPVGAPATASIGPGGGTLASPDGVLNLVVPAGAVANSTTFSIQPITYPEGGEGPAYRLTPDGLTFAQPVTLTFSYATEDIGDDDAQGLGLAYQDADGVWRALLESSVDETAKTVSVASTHFTDFIRVQFWRFVPQRAVLDVNQTLALSVEACIREDPAPTDEPAVGFDAEDQLPGLPRCNPSIRTGRWSVNGVQGGTAVSGRVVTGASTASAIYTAPAQAPTPNPVTVTADMTWEARGVTKRFTSRVTIGGAQFHVVGELSRTFEGIGGLVGSDITDGVEFDIELSQGDVVVPLASIVNRATTRSNDRLPPQASGFCRFTVDSPYEFGEFDTFASGYTPPGSRVLVAYSGASRMAATSLYVPVDGICTFLQQSPSSQGRTVDAYLEFDPTEYTAVGDQHFVAGAGPGDAPNGWSFTITRTR